MEKFVGLESVWFIIVFVELRSRDISKRECFFLWRVVWVGENEGVFVEDWFDVGEVSSYDDGIVCCLEN